MMIGSDDYIYRCQHYGMDRLIKERDSLMRNIRKLEKILFSPNQDTIGHFPNPGPDVQYQMYLEYLSELCNLMEDKFRNRGS